MRLHSPFRPEPDGLEEYDVGVVVSLIYNESKPDATEISGVLLHLVNSVSFQVYVDHYKAKAIFYFQVNEIETQQ